MLKFNMKTDYAVRIVLYLAIKMDFASSYEIAEEMGIPRTYILKLTKILEKAGILQGKRGADGGFLLSVPPQELPLLTILGLFENTMLISRCLEANAFCSRCAAPYCKVRELLLETQMEVNSKLSAKISEFL